MPNSDILRGLHSSTETQSGGSYTRIWVDWLNYMHPHWYTPAKKSNRGRDPSAFRSCPNCKTLYIKFSSCKAEDTLAACKWKWEAVPKPVIPFLQDFILPSGKGTRPRALRNFLLFLSTALAGAFSLSCIAFWYCNALGRQPSKKTFRSSQRVRPSHNHPLWKIEKPQTDAHKLGIRKEGMGGAAWLLLVILNSIGESYRPWIRKETNLNFQCELWDQHFTGQSNMHI